MDETTPPGGRTGTPPPPPPSGDPGPGVRPLRRSSRDRWLGGVASGLGRYLGVDPVLMRVGLIALGIIAFFPVAVLYIAALFVIPSDDAPDTRSSHPLDRRPKLFAAIAGVVLLVGLLVDAEHEGAPIYTPWLVLFAALVLVIVWLARRDRGSWGPPPWAGAGGAPWADHLGNWHGPHAPAAAAFGDEGNATASTPTSSASGSAAASSASAASDPTVTVPATPYPAEAYAAAPHAAASHATAVYPPYPLVPSDEPVPERSALGALTFGAALLVAGILVALDRGDVISVPAMAVFGSALAVVGLGLLVGTWFGRARGLIGLGVALAIVTALAGVVNVPASNSVGEQQWRPTTAAAVEPTYSWGVGEVELDLRSVSSSTPVTTSLELGIGDATIRVPATAVVEIKADVGAGAVAVTDGDGTVRRADGINRDEAWRSEPSAEALREAGKDARPTTFVLDLSVGLGQVEVLRA